MEIIDQSKVWTELSGVDGREWMAQEATRLGFPVAGFMSDVYEDAVILIPPLFRFEWRPGGVCYGRVLHITNAPNRKADRKDGTMGIVYVTDDGIQVTKSYGAAYPVYFALPENTEDAFRS